MSASGTFLGQKPYPLVPSTRNPPDNALFSYEQSAAAEDFTHRPMPPKRERATPPHHADSFDGDLSDERRVKTVESDDARKRSARWYSNIGLRVPPAFFRREAEEIDALRDEREVHGRRNGEDNSRGASRSSSSTALD